MDINPDYPEPYDNIGLAVANRGQFDEAIEWNHKALKYDPNDPMATQQKRPDIIRCFKQDLPSLARGPQSSGK